VYDKLLKPGHSFRITLYFQQNETAYIFRLWEEIVKVSLEKGKVVKNELGIEQKKWMGLETQNERMKSRGILFWARD